MRNTLDANGDLTAVLGRKATHPQFWAYANNFKYSAAGAVTQTQLGNGLWESTQFNSRLQPTQIALGSSQNGTDKLRLDYQYGDLDWNGSVIAGTNNGNVAKQTITVAGVGATPGFTAVQNYDYDPLNRIQIASETLTPTIGSPETWAQEFRYDRYGNRTFHEPTTTTLPKQCNNNTEVCATVRPVVNPSVSSANNRLSGYSFDGAGNTTYDAEGRKFTYDGENKQLKVETVSGPTVTGTVGEYWYDGDGKRIKKRRYENNVVTEETVFAYDAGGNLIGEYSSPLSQDAKIAYLTNDHLGSPRINTDVNGNVTARHDYQPFGEEVVSSKRVFQVGYGEDTVRKQFTGYEWDEETEINVAGARMYASSIGRFSTVDPLLGSAIILLPQSWNRYSYVFNNPLNSIDPTGMWVWGDGFGGGKKESELTDDERKKRKEFNDSLDKARLVAALLAMSDNPVDNMRGAEITRALDAYGDEGVDNGVTLMIAKLADTEGGSAKLSETAAVRINDAGELVPNITVKFAKGQNIDPVKIAHEGSHVADNAAFANLIISDQAMSQESWLASGQNVTMFRTESRAYWAGSYVAESLGSNQNSNGTEYWNEGWSKADKETKRANGITRILKSQYGVESITNEGRRLAQLKPKK